MPHDEFCSQFEVRSGREGGWARFKERERELREEGGGEGEREEKGSRGEGE